MAPWKARYGACSFNHGRKPGSTTRGTIIAFTAAFALAAAGVLFPATARPALVIAVIAAAAWAAGEHFGQISSGQATGPNTGPLLILIAIAFWPSGKVKIVLPNEK